MEITRTRTLVTLAMLAALGGLLNLIEIPYPIAPWLMIDLAEVVVLVAFLMHGFKGGLIVSVAKFFVSLLIKGPVGPFGIGQITALIGSLTILGFYMLFDKVFRQKYVPAIIATMLCFAVVMVVINYLFVTPTYLSQKFTWYTQLPYTLDINAFNEYFGMNLPSLGFLGWLGPYGEAIFIIYFPFNLLKGLVTGFFYRVLKPVIVKNFIKQA